MTTFWQKFWIDDQGQDLIEYTLMLAFVALASAALFSTTSTSINTIWANTNNELSSVAGS
ncbi:MAG: Flp family type IVb pilin [Bryobacteraceae bacterium]